MKKIFRQAIILRAKCNAGSIFSFAGLLLTLLTTIGIISVTRISGNAIQNKNYQRSKTAFYVAESGWAEGAMWLEKRFSPPSFHSNLGNIVRKCEDKFLMKSSNNLRNTDTSAKPSEKDEIDYGYRIEYLKNRPTPGSGAEYRRFFYKIESYADNDQEISVKISKIYKVGY